MILGFIGCGKISFSVITGILSSRLKVKKIFVSKRNSKISSYLKKKYKKIIVTEENQEIINKSDWVFLAITPLVGEKIIKKLKFKPNQKIISFISTITIPKLKRMIKIKADIVRAIPLPPISLKQGPIPICPPNKKVKKFFDRLGSTVEIKNEKLSINFWSTSGMMASYYELLRTMSDWLVKKGVKRLDAQKYITSLFLALSKDAVVNSKKDLKYLVKESQTSKGLNEQALKDISKKKVYRSIVETLDNLHKRLNK
ncbi:NAD(P)-binding domain-containing protein [Pelagibacterales bacterium SAG-MED30]|nr:NAD(P)-binding domain-containing protein [Pelagibacterales bacterium SAG-MED30]|tara:strand:+ start:3261 stop:4028 length:768 start_codon:yes stop_codon:yes gene_type:complete